VGGEPLPLRDALRARGGSTLMITAPTGPAGAADQDDVLTREGDDVYVGCVSCVFCLSCLASPFTRVSISPFHSPEMDSESSRRCKKRQVHARGL
jgi:hypothetical protein